MNWQILIASAAQKQLKKIHWQDSEKISLVISHMVEDPFFGDIQKMTDKDGWRRRVGSYRIFYTVDPGAHLIYVFEITRRTSKTY